MRQGLPAVTAGLTWACPSLHILSKGPPLAPGSQGKEQAPVPTTAITDGF